MAKLRRTHEALAEGLPDRDNQPIWIVMSAITVEAGRLNRGLYSVNATGLTKAEAEAVAKIRNEAEAKHGTGAAMWFVSMDPMAALKIARGQLT